MLMNLMIRIIRIAIPIIMVTDDDDDYEDL